MSKQKGIFRPLCLAVILGLGVQVVAAFLVGWCAVVATQLVPSHGLDEYLVFRWDGTPVICSFHRDNPSHRTYRTFDGTLLHASETALAGTAASLPGPTPSPLVPGRLAWSQRIRSYSDGAEQPVYWHFVHDGKTDGRGYFVGFNTESKHRVGYIGQGGARSHPPASNDWFPLDARKLGLYAGGTTSRQQHRGPGGRPDFAALDVEGFGLHPWNVYLLSGKRVVEVDLRRRSARTLIEADDVVSIGTVRRAFPNRGKPSAAELAPQEYQSFHRLAVRTTDKMVVLDPRDGKRAAYPIPAAVGRRAMKLYQLDNESVIADVRRRATGAAIAHDIYWIPPGAEPERHAVVELKTQGTPGGNRRMSAVIGLLAPVPTLWAVAATVVAPLTALTSGQAPDYSRALATSFSNLWPSLLISLVLAVAATWLCVRRQRQYAMPWTRTWAVLVLVLGPPALLGYLFHRVWPTRIACPACSQPVPRDRDACPRCNIPLPEPKAMGIEIVA